MRQGEVLKVTWWSLSITPSATKTFAADGNNVSRIWKCRNDLHSHVRRREKMG